jgi:AcrR family transcriptional regulator
VPRPMTHDSDGHAPRKLPPGRHGLPRQFVLHNQRARLVDAAIHVFGTRSFGEARVADVLELAAISRKTFYEQFADKEACFLAAYEAAATRARDAVRLAARDERDWPARLRAAIGGLMRFLSEEPILARLLVVEVMGAGPTALRRRNQMVREVASLVAEMQGAAGHLSAQVAVGGLCEVVHAMVLDGRTAELPELADALAECALAQLGGGGSPKAVAAG